MIRNARKINTQLTVVDQSSNYDAVKEKLTLKAYDLVPEAYRQTFRNCGKTDQIHVEFARPKEQLFDTAWSSSKKSYTVHAKRR